MTSRLARSFAALQRRALLALASLAFFLALASTQGAHAAVCSGDTEPPGTFWSACMTVGNSALDGFSFGYNRGLELGALTSPKITIGTAEATFNLIRLKASKLRITTSHQAFNSPNWDNWVLHVEDDTFAFADFSAELPSGIEWNAPGLSWAADDEISLALALPPIVPGAPVLTATANGATQIDLSWTVPPDGGSRIDRYQIDVSANGGTTWKPLRDIFAITTTSHTGLTGGTTRHYRVSAVNAIGTGAWSNVDSATTNNPATGSPLITGTPQVGQSLYASIGGIMDADGTSNIVVSYQWIRVDGATETDIQGATITPYTPVAGDVGKQIKVRGSFTDDAGNPESRTSAATQAVLAAAGANTPATGSPLITGTPQVGQSLYASIGGIMDADGTSNIVVSYQWIRVDGATETDIQGATITPYTPVAGDVGKQIKVRLSFTDDAGNPESRTSAATQAVLAAAGANTPATGSPLITGTPQVGQSLYASIGGIMDADGTSNIVVSYQWIRVDGATETDIQGATITPYTPVAGDVGKQIKVRLSFTDDAGNPESRTSAATQAVLAAAGANTAPGVPRTLAAAPGDGEVVLTWTAPASTGGEAITRYEHRHKATGSLPFVSSDSWTSAGTALTATVGSLTNGTPYSFEVRAVNSVGAGTAATTSATPTAAATAPGVPRTLAAAPGDGEVVLTWTAPASTGGEAITRYEHRHKATGSLPFVSSDSWTSAGTALTATVGSLTNGTPYSFEVRAVNSVGAGTAATTSATPTAAATAPGVPRTLAAAPGDGEVVLTWTAPASTGGEAITRYEHRHKATGSLPFVSSDSWTSAGTALTATVGSLTNGTPYSFEVRAVNSVGAGTAATASATPTAATVQPPAAGDCAPSVANAVWTACLTVDRRIEDGSDYAQVGYDTVDSGIGGLSDTEFERGGSDYTVERLLWDNGKLRFHLSAGLGATDVANLTLHVGGAARALSRATVEGDGAYTWSRSATHTDTHKLGLTDGATVPVVLATTGTVADNRAAKYRPKIVAAAGGTAEAVAQVGTQLRVDIRGITDRDGTTNPRWSYQWIGGRNGIDSGTGKINPYRAIDRATVATYTPKAADVGKLLKVRVSFTDDAGHVEHRISWAVGPVIAGSAQQSGSQGAGGRPIAGFTLFDNAAGGADVQALTDGAALAALSSGRLNIRAEAAAGAEIGSVRMELSGAVTSARTEGIAPYALFGDRGGRAFPAGTYTVTATPYPERGLSGTPGPASSVTFTVAGAAAAPSVTVTSTAQAPVSGEFQVTVRFSEPVAGFRMSELVIANGRATRSASLTDRQGYATEHEVYVAPDAGASGAVTITVPAGVATDADGNPNTASAAFAIAIAWDPLTGFTMFDNAAGGADVRALSDGTVLRGLVSGQLNVRANTRSGASIGSVRMALSGAASSSRTENYAPWALFGDRGGRAFAPGSYTVTATPYPERDLGGTAGKTRSVTFRVVLPALSVADARAEEGTDETIDFAVTLDAASRGRVTVDYATSDGTAKAGADYAAKSGTLTFTAGETAKTVAVTVLDDAIDEGSETLTLTLSNASGATIADGTATGTITNNDPLQKMWLSRFGRTVAGHVVDAVAGRLSGPSAGTQVTLGGQRIGLSGTGGEADAAAAALDTLAGARQAREAGDAWAGSGAWPDARGGSWRGAAEGGGTAARSMTGRELLLGTAFHLASDGDAGGPAWAAWGRVTAGGFDAKAPSDNGTVRMDGEVTTGILGADAAWDRWLAGVALSVSEGEGTFDQPGVDRGTLESRLTAVHPYVRVEVNDRVSAWGLVGYGTGEMTMTQAARDNRGEIVTRTDIEMRLGAAGVRGALLEAADAGGFDLALRGDAFLVQMEWEKVSNETDTRADASRVRLVLEGSRAFEMAGGAVLTPGLELGLRHDGGDAETGTGVEAGGSVRYADPESGLTVEASARRLIAHEDGGYEEWGVSGSVRLDPGASGRGLSLTLAPTIGAASSGVDRLWSARDAAGLAANDDFEAERRLEAEVGYGLGGPEGLGVVTPYAGLGLAGGDARTWRAGARWTIGPSFALGLDGSRREAANDDAPDHGLMLRGSLRW